MRLDIAALALGATYLVSALPSSNSKRQNGQPLLNLGYATHSGEYNSTYDTYVFRNIRFAAPPVGDLRWAKPASPLPQSGIQDGTVGRSCVQAGRNSRPGPPSNAGEDCLFLDVTVPGKVIREPGKHSLPVTVWFYGGAYITGSKEKRGGAEAMIRASGGNIVWVAGNYRLGSYGFLNGVTMEKEATPNAGLWDQHAVLQWVQQHIPRVGGDPKTVTAMGISAGAGSIQHHLVFEGGNRDPLFTRAIIQSPGYQNYQDRPGQLEQDFKRFENLAGCKGRGLPCLRALSESDLKAASDKANQGLRQGTFAFGPAPDGKLIHNVPSLELAAGHFFKGMETVISSHVTDEGGSFTDAAINTDDKFDELMDLTFGNSSALAPPRSAINTLYPPVSAPNSPFKTEKQRHGLYITEGSFTCHNRAVADAYAGKAYVVHYAVPPARHGGDQDATFFSPLNPRYAGTPAAELEARQGFQSYLASYIRSGNPNKYRNNATTIEWPMATGFSEAMLSNTLVVETLAGKQGFKVAADSLMARERCQFWTDVLKAKENSLKSSAGSPS